MAAIDSSERNPTLFADTTCRKNHRGDAAQTAVLEAWLTAILDEFAQNILAIDEDVGQLWGRLRVPHAEHALDKLIAATALIHDLIVVTRNVDDFSSTGVRLLNPFD